MYYIVVVNNVVTALQQNGKVETSGTLTEFATLDELNEYIVANELIYSDNIDTTIFDLDDHKKTKIALVSQMAFEKRKLIAPDYKLVNAGLGIYDEATILSYKLTVQAFRDEFYKASDLINAKTSKADVDKIVAEFPTSLI